MLSDELDSLFEDFDIIKGIENYLEIFQETAPRVVKRKIRFNFKGSKFKYRKGISYNLLHDMLPSPNLVLKPLIRMIQNNKTTLSTEKG